jgi:hypothetical protein
MWHDTLDICPDVAEFFQSGPGLAFLEAIRKLRTLISTVPPQRLCNEMPVDCVQ